MGGQCPLIQGFRKPSQYVSLPFAPYTYYAKAFFSEWFLCRTGFYLYTLLFAAPKGCLAFTVNIRLGVLHLFFYTLKQKNTWVLFL